jgi:hypothetical protein
MKKSSPTKLAATWLKQAATRAGQCGSWLLICTVSVGWFLMALLVLLPWLALDFLPSRKSKQLTSQVPFRRKLQIPLREGSQIFVLNPDGTKVPVTRLEAVNQARAWNDVCFGAYVFQELPAETEA